MISEAVAKSDTKMKPQQPDYFYGEERNTVKAQNWVFEVELYLGLAQVQPYLRVLIASQYLKGNALT